MRRSHCMHKLQRIVNIVVSIGMVLFVGYSYITFPRFPLTSFPPYVTLYYSIPFLIFLAIFNGVILYIRHKERIHRWKEHATSNTDFPGEPPVIQKPML